MAPKNQDQSRDELLRIGRLVTGLLGRMLELDLVQGTQVEALASMLSALLDLAESAEE